MNGIKVSVLSTNQIAQALGLDAFVIRNWSKRGYMPPPYIEMVYDSGGRKAGYWLRRQVVVLAWLVDLFYGNHYRRIPWMGRPDLVEFVYEAFEKMADETHTHVAKKLAARHKTANPSSKFRYGVEFTDE